MVEKFVTDDRRNRTRKSRFSSVALRFAWGNFAIKGILCCDKGYIAMRLSVNHVMIKGISQRDKGYSLMKSIYFLDLIKSQVL